MSRFLKGKKGQPFGMSKGFHWDVYVADTPFVGMTSWPPVLWIGALDSLGAVSLTSIHQLHVDQWPGHPQYMV